MLFTDRHSFCLCMCCRMGFRSIRKTFFLSKYLKGQSDYKLVSSTFRCKGWFFRTKMQQVALWYATHLLTVALWYWNLLQWGAIRTMNQTHVLPYKPRTSKNCLIRFDSDIVLPKCHFIWTYPRVIIIPHFDFRFRCVVI